MDWSHLGLLESEDDDHVAATPETQIHRSRPRGPKKKRSPKVAPSEQKQQHQPQQRQHQTPPRRTRPKSAPKLAHNDSPLVDEDYSSVDEQSSEADIPLPPDGSSCSGSNDDEEDTSVAEASTQEEEEGDDDVDEDVGKDKEVKGQHVEEQRLRRTKVR